MREPLLLLLANLALTGRYPPGCVVLFSSFAACLPVSREWWWPGRLLAAAASRFEKTRLAVAGQLAG